MEKMQIMMRNLSVGVGVAIVLLSFAATADAQTSSAAPLTVASAGPADLKRPTSDTPALQQRNPRYRVTRDDVLALSFPLSPELNQKVTIQPDGYINLQTAGSLYVQGMTVPELVEAIKKA